MYQLWIVTGPNGSGKTTLTRKHLASRLPVVNPDDIARELAGLPTVTPDIAIQAGRQALIRQKRLIAQRHSFALETTFSGVREINLMRDAKAAGYKVNLVFVCTDTPILSIGRIASRVADGGHDVPAADVHRRYQRSLANLPAGITLADRTWLLDNSRNRMRLVVSIENGQVKSQATSLPRWVRNARLAILERESGLSR
jgi:predicted ABC-type ATPase